MGRWLLRACVALWEAKGEGVVGRRKGVWAHLAIERGHEYERTWPP